MGKASLNPVTVRPATRRPLHICARGPLPAALARILGELNRPVHTSATLPPSHALPYSLVLLSDLPEQPTPAEQRALDRAALLLSDEAPPTWTHTLLTPVTPLSRLTTAGLQEQLHRRRLTILDDLEGAVQTRTSLDALVPDTTALLAALLNCPTVQILRHDADAGVLIPVGSDPDPQPWPLIDYPALAAALTGRLPHKVDAPDGTAVWLLVPLSSLSRPLLLRWIDDAGDGFSQADEMLAQSAAHILATRLALLEQLARTRRLAQKRLDDFQRRAQLLDLLSGLTLAVGTLDPKEFLQSAVGRIGTLLGVDNCFITRWNDDHRQVVQAAAFGPASDYFMNVRWESGEDSLTASVLGSGESLVISDLRDFAAARQRLANDPRTIAVLVVPLQTPRQKLGALFLAHDHPYAFQPSEVAEVERIARLVSLALANIELFEDTRRQLEELRLLHEIAQAGTHITDEDALIAFVTELIGSTVYSDNFGILLLSADGRTLLPHRTYTTRTNPDYRGPQAIPLGEGITGMVAATGRSICLADVRRHRAFLRVDQHTLSELCVPLRVGDQILGVVNAESHTLGAFAEDDERLLSTLAGQIAVAIHEIRLLKQAQQSSSDSETLMQFAMQLRAVSSVDDTTERILQRAQQLARAEAVQLYVVDPRSNDLIVRGALQTEDLPELPEHVQLDLVNLVVSSGKPYVSENLAEDALAALPDEARVAAALRAAMLLPLRSQGWIVGVLCIFRRAPAPFTTLEADRLARIADIAGSALDRAQVLESLERRVAERTRDLEFANRRLQELDRLKTKFVSDVSHELRTPVTSLQLYLDLLQHGSSEKRERYLAMMRMQTERLTELIEDTLSLARIEMAGDRTQMRAVNFNEVVGEVIDALRPHAEAAELDFTFSAGALPTLMGERNQLTQVATNLIANALRYTPAGFVRVTTHYDREAESISLTVADSGVGIPAADRPHLFERFYRGEKMAESTIAGSGLGLAIVAEVVQLHRGDVVVESEEGQGSVFTVTLPLKQPEA